MRHSPCRIADQGPEGIGRPGVGDGACQWSGRGAAHGCNLPRTVGRIGVCCRYYVGRGLSCTTTIASRSIAQRKGTRHRLHHLDQEGLVFPCTTFSCSNVPCNRGWGAALRRESRTLRTGDALSAVLTSSGILSLQCWPVCTGLLSGILS